MDKAKDAIIILGGGLKRDGSLHEFVRARVREGAQLYENKTAPRLIMCGAYSFILGFVPPKTEARAMGEYAESLGVSRGDIILEERSKDTVGNIYFAKKILRKRGWRDVIFVTSAFHAARAEFLAVKILGRKYGIGLIATADSAVTDKFAWMVRKEKKMFDFSRYFFGLIAPGWSFFFAIFLLAEHFMFWLYPSFLKRKLKCYLARG